MGLVTREGVAQGCGAAPWSASGRRDVDDEFLAPEATKPRARSPSQSARDGVLVGDDAGNKAGCQVDVVHVQASQADATRAEAALDVERFTRSVEGLCDTGLRTDVVDAASIQDVTATLDKSCTRCC